MSNTINYEINCPRGKSLTGWGQLDLRMKRANGHAHTKGNLIRTKSEQN